MLGEDKTPVEWQAKIPDLLHKHRQIPQKNYIYIDFRLKKIKNFPEKI